VTAVGGSVGAYAGLFVLLALSWAGLPVAGQAALVAAGVLASDGELSISIVLAVGIAASAIGGVAAYMVGLHGGRAAITAPGPLRGLRVRALDKGEELFGRYGAAAVLFGPMWLAGIHRMPWRSFLAWNAVAAVGWTVVAGLGAFLIGPAITDVLKRAGVVVAAVAAAIVVVVLVRRLRSTARNP
jgi:membrane protein DedA with SNARE-associated domain